MKRLFKKKHLTINENQLHPGDIFIVHDTIGHKKIRYAQKLTGNIQYSNFVHGGIIGLDSKSIIHSSGGDDGLHSSNIGYYFDDVEDYRIFRLKDNFSNLAQQIAEVADMMYKKTRIPYALQGADKTIYFDILIKTMLLKNKKPPKDALELEREMDGFLRKDPQFTTYCTRFVTFVIQYACLKTNLDSTKILGKLRDTKAIPARLTELLKRNSCFTEFKNCDDDYDGVSIDTLAHNTQAIHPTNDPSPTLAWSPRPAPPPPIARIAPQRPAPPPPIARIAPQRPAPPPPIARIAPQRPAPPPPINNLDPSPLQRQGAKRWVNTPILGPSPLQRQGARRWPKPPEQA